MRRSQIKELDKTDDGVERNVQTRQMNTGLVALVVVLTDQNYGFLHKWSKSRNAIMA